ncbi:hypothetical protein GCM10010393_38330 [Streptomyces gobitricini]|uniref:Small hydrophobic protein n=1 Tax=Streptomyces gobitricini TaxID=68211 RepID=A0ABN3MHK3_9ACTN
MGRSCSSSTPSCRAPRPTCASARAPTGADPDRSVRMSYEGKFPRGLVIRLFAYLVAGHLFAAFLYLLFALGAE